MRILHLGKYYPPEPGGMEVVVKSFADATAGILDELLPRGVPHGEDARRDAPGARPSITCGRRARSSWPPSCPAFRASCTGLRRSGASRSILLHYPNPTATLALFLSLLARPKREKIVVWNHADILLEERWKRALYALFRPIEEFVFRRTDAFVAATPHHVSSSDTFRRFSDRTADHPVRDSGSVVRGRRGGRGAAEQVRERHGGAVPAVRGPARPVQGAGHAAPRRRPDPVPHRDRRDGAARGGAAEGDRGAGAVRPGPPAREVEDLRPYYLGCEFFVLPSVSALEGFGIVQIEAMALGKPVVSSDLPSGVTYVNVHGETGLVFPVGDDAGLAEACNRLLSDAELRERLGENAQGEDLRGCSPTRRWRMRRCRSSARLCGRDG